MSLAGQTNVVSSVQTGLSLIESLTCVAIVSLLISLAAPELRAIWTRQRVMAVQGEVRASMQWARTEAMRRNVVVTLQRRTDCAMAPTDEDDWSCGWHGLAGNQVNKRTQPAPAEILLSFSVPDGLRLIHQGGGSLLQFSRWGQPVLVAHKFVLGPRLDGPYRDTAMRLTSTLCINRAGKARVVEGQTTCS